MRGADNVVLGSAIVGGSVVATVGGMVVEVVAVVVGAGGWVVAAAVVDGPLEVLLSPHDARLLMAPTRTTAFNAAPTKDEKTLALRIIRKR